ncbi:hypothetical protein FRC19_005305, partial [Serendipita sp. 401]
MSVSSKLARLYYTLCPDIAALQDFDVYRPLMQSSQWSQRDYSTYRSYTTTTYFYNEEDDEFYDEYGQDDGRCYQFYVTDCYEEYDETLEWYSDVYDPMTDHICYHYDLAGSKGYSYRQYIGGGENELLYDYGYSHADSRSYCEWG